MSTHISSGYSLSTERALDAEARRLVQLLVVRVVQIDYHASVEDGGVSIGRA